MSIEELEKFEHLEKMGGNVHTAQEIYEICTVDDDFTPEESDVWSALCGNYDSIRYFKDFRGLENPLSHKKTVRDKYVEWKFKDGSRLKMEFRPDGTFIYWGVDSAHLGSRHIVMDDSL